MSAALDETTWEVIASDYSMPQFDTLAALSLLHERGLDLPFIIVSGRIGEDVAVKAMKAGAHDYIMKGNLARLVPAIQRELREASQRREHRRAEEDVRRYHERLKILHEIDQAILTAQSPEEIAQATLRRIRKLVPSKRATIMLFDFESDEAIILADKTSGRTRIKEGMKVPLNTLGNDLEPLRRGEIRIVDDVEQMEERPRLVQVLKGEGMRSYVRVPLMSRDELIGSISFSADVPNAFSPEHIEIAREIAAPIAIAIQQVRLHEQIRRHAAELEQRVTERTAELEQMNAELESFSYSIAHDLRAPLRAMQGFADALIEDYADQLPPEAQEYSNRIGTAAQRLDTLIQDLLAYSRLSRADMPLRAVSLSSVVTEVLARLEPELKEHHARIEVDEGMPEVQANRPTVIQVVGNLLMNAVKFVAPGVEPRVRIHAETADRHIRLWIEDNGIGINPEYHERIFRVFERLHGADVYPGNGIGLAIVRKGMERMNGHVGVTSEEGAGSKFWVEWPGVESTL
jgi:signal transduction histidine kinase